MWYALPTNLTPVSVFMNSTLPVLLKGINLYLCWVCWHTHQRYNMTDLGCAKVPKTSRMLLHKKPHGASPRKQEMDAPSTRWDQEHSQCEVIHTSTPDVLIKGDLRKWFPQVFLLVSTSDGIKKGERGTRSRGVRHLTVTLTVMTNFCYIRWLHGWFTSLHQCIPSLNCIHYVHSILKSQLPARKKFHFSQCYISNLIHLMLKSWNS